MPEHIAQALHDLGKAYGIHRDIKAVVLEACSRQGDDGETIYREFAKSRFQELPASVAAELLFENGLAHR